MMTGTSPLRAQPAADLEPVDAGQHQVEDDQVRRSRARTLAGPRSPSDASATVVSGAREVGDDDLAHGGVVVDDEHARPSGTSFVAGARRPVCSHRRETATPTRRTTPAKTHQPRTVVPVEQGRVVRPGAEAAEHRNRRHRHRDQHHEPGDGGARHRRRRQHAHADHDGQRSSAARGPRRARTTPPASHSSGVHDAGAVVLEEPEQAERGHEHAQRTDQHASPHVTHLDPGHPLGLEDPGTVRRDQPARVAVVEGRGPHR